jgi:hypothetical protein
MNFLFKKKREIIPHQREPLSLPYKGGEILCLFLDNFTNHTELMKETILKNEKLSHRWSMPFFVVYELTDTEVTFEIAEFLIDSIMRMGKNIGKLAFVGTTRQGRKHLTKCLAKYRNDLNFAVNYFYGHEPAKEWFIPG